MFWASGALANHDCSPVIKHKQAQNRNTHSKTVGLAVTKILSPVARQAPTQIALECPFSEGRFQKGVAGQVPLQRVSGYKGVSHEMLSPTALHTATLDH